MPTDDFDDLPVQSVLQKYFPSGTAEGDSLILDRTFVQVNEYIDILTPQPGSPRLLVGKKGSGKSALLAFASQGFSQMRIPCVLMKPSDIPIPVSDERAPLSELIAHAKSALIRAIGAKIGASLQNGLLLGADATLYNEAIASGEREPDTVGKLSRVLSAFSQPLTGVDFSKLLEIAEPGYVKRLTGALKVNLSTTKGVFYLFIDDTDQVASPGVRGHLNRIWALLLSARDLCQEIPQIRCIITLREEVWRRLLYEDAAQRDQTDHFSGLVAYLNPTLDHIEEIVNRRIVLASEELGAKDGRAHYDIFFEGTLVKIPTSTQRSGWKDIITRRSRERPRDAIQLVLSLSRRAAQTGREKIDQDSLEVVLPSFSMERVDKLQEENDDCTHLREVIRSFANLDFDEGSFKGGAETIRSHLMKVPSKFAVRIHHNTIRQGNESDAIILWKFLFETGVLNARISDSGQKDGFRHIRPMDDPNLVSKARWNEMQKIVWEINAAYRDYIISVQNEMRAQTGLATTRKHRRR